MRHVRFIISFSAFEQNQRSPSLKEEFLFYFSDAYYFISFYRRTRTHARTHAHPFKNQTILIVDAVQTDSLMLFIAFRGNLHPFEFLFFQNIHDTIAFMVFVIYLKRKWHGGQSCCSVFNLKILAFNQQKKKGL